MKIALLLILTLLLVACAPAPAAPTDQPAQNTQPPSAAPTDQAVQSAEQAATPTAEQAASADSEAAAAYVGPEWLNLPLVNARTGETFTLASFAGRTVFVEPMATWCTNCRAQMGRVREVYQQLNPAQFVFVGLSVETNISADDLAGYVDQQNFPWIFAVASPEVLQALNTAFGRDSLNPPSTPHFYISPDGTLTSLYTGAQSAADITAIMQGLAGA
ncbi:MAG: TlpA family protein disulfide reductase [Chloroflexi bacterium]|nr:TlpA family protein disulfide reductase [Chloroflexota bacterium]